jgi:hypothetical protein
MICPKCKSEQPDTAQFCSQCAQPLTEHGKTIARANTNPWPWVFLTAVLLVILAVAVEHNLNRAARQKEALQRAVAAQQRQPTGIPVPEPQPEPPIPEPPPAPQPQAQFIPITNGAATVAASSFAWYTFVVPPNADTVAINGRFTATGGMGNDIVCYILDEDGLVNFKNGHPTRTFFNSGKVTTAKIGAVNLAPGTYYLVLDNRYSILTPKAVQITAVLSYRQ